MVVQEYQEAIEHIVQTCQTVSIKNIAMPPTIAETMSKHAQAERERMERVILGTVETEITEKFVQLARSIPIIKQPYTLEV